MLKETKEMIYNGCLDFENYQVSDPEEDHKLIIPIQHFVVFTNLLSVDKELRDKKDDWEAVKERFAEMGLDVEEVGLSQESFEWISKNFIVKEESDENLSVEIGVDALNAFDAHMSNVVTRVQTRFVTVRSRIDRLTDLLSKTERILMDNRIDTNSLDLHMADVVAPDYVEQFAEDTKGMVEYCTKALDGFFSNLKVDVHERDENGVPKFSDAEKAACGYGLNIETNANGMVTSQCLQVGKQDDPPVGKWDSQARQVLAKARHALEELNSSVLNVYATVEQPDFVEGANGIGDFGTRASSADALIVLSRGIENTIVHRGRDLTLAVRRLMYSIKD